MNNALNYALKLLAKKDYTEQELRQKFKSREIREEDAEKAILFLTERKFIDDDRYARQYLRNHPSRGPVRIKFELIRKGINEDIISSALKSSSDEVERARDVAEEWLKRKSGKYDDKYKLKQNIIAKLSRQGFSYDVICQAMQGLLD